MTTWIWYDKLPTKKHLRDYTGDWKDSLTLPDEWETKGRKQMKERPDCEYCGWGKQLRIQHAYGERREIWCGKSR